MSNALDHPLVNAYLASVEAEAAVLSGDRRADLVADLREHIASVAPSAGDDAAVREALDRLGTPREIAAAAIAEEPGVEPLRPQSGTRTAVTLGMLVLGAPFWVVGIGLVLSVVAAVRIWRSPSWADRDKRLGVAGAFSPLLVTPAAAALLGSSGRLGAPELFGAFLIAAVIPLIVAVRLGRGAARLRP